MRIVEVRKNILIRHKFNADLANAQWNESINIEFIPDEVIVRAISYSSQNDEAGVSLIWTDLVNDSYLGTYIDDAISNPNQVFTIGRPVRGVYAFKGLFYSGNLDNVALGVIVISLEFIKYIGKQNGEILGGNIYDNTQTDKQPESQPNSTTTA